MPRESQIDKLLKTADLAEGSRRAELLDEIFRIFGGAKGIAEELKANCDALGEGHNQRVRIALAITELALKVAEKDKPSDDPEELGMQIVEALEQLSPQHKSAALTLLQPDAKSA